MKNLQVTAYLSSPIAVYDDYTPQLEGLLIYLFLDRLGLAHPNPNLQQIKDCEKIIGERLPIKKNNKYGFYYCSNPVYTYISEEKSNFRKRWDTDNKYINWGKRKAKIETSQGAEKNYDLPLFLRSTTRIDWFCIGDKSEIEILLKNCTGLGKKRSHGFGQVSTWEVTEIQENWSLIRNGELMKPVSGKVFQELKIDKFYNLMQWGWKPPVWLPENKDLCCMPEVVKRG